MRNRWLLVAAGTVISIAALVYAFGDSLTAAVQTPALAPTHMVAVPPPIPPEYLPPPFEERRIVFPTLGEAAASETAVFCDDGKWSQIDLVVSRTDDGAFWVDEDAWNRELTGSKVGLASWMSQCYRDGSPIEIVAAETGALLATYDARTGLRSHP